MRAARSARAESLLRPRAFFERRLVGAYDFARIFAIDWCNGVVRTAHFLQCFDSLRGVSTVESSTNNHTQQNLGETMNRRRFVRSTSLIAATGAVSMAAPLAFSAGLSGSLLTTPELCVGRKFLLDNGKYVTLERVDVTTRDATWHQWELHFSAADEIVDGTFGLASESGAAAVLYMQSAGKGARASVSRKA